jgi:methylase of polypeptide subunit release factors
MSETVLPYPPEFPALLEDYCEQMGAAICANSHHDQRRHLFLNFLREAFGVDPVEVELEHKLKVGELRGLIDALYRHIIVEVKTDFENERGDAQRELKKYFASRPRPAEYIGIVTDGIRFEAWHLNHSGELISISEIEVRADEPLAAWRWLDQFLSTGVRRIPTSDELVCRFGVQTAIFTKVADGLLALYESVKEEPLVAVKFREWNALLAKVYGSPLGKPALFVNHTYLTLISRIIVTLALKGVPPKKAELRGLVDGSFFARQLNLKNLAEPDFFSWALDTQAEANFLVLLGNLFQHFAVFDFSKLSEDVLKNLYQELVDPEARHDLGEYYTPDWLAELTLDRIAYKGGKILDPACGSGGFLFAAVHALRNAGLKGNKLVTNAVENVMGIDVHPVAVLMAKANMLLALRHELADFGGDVTLRVYMADTLMAEEDKSKGLLTIPVTSKEIFHIPLATVARGELDDLIDFLSQFAHRGSKDDAAADHATKAVKARLLTLTADKESFWWLQNFKLLLKLGKQRRNTIWAYILKNAYRPEFLRQEKVDYIVGNPPWLSYRYIKDEGYKERVKSLTFDHALLARGEVKLFTQMDTSTLFVAHCEREFLRPGGVLAMVLPKTVILPAKQHRAFQRKGFNEVHDFTDVEPLFNVRTCMVVRRAPYGASNVPRFSYAGKMPRRNLCLTDALPILTCEQGTISFDGPSGQPSPYYDRFLNGATLWPRCLVFVEPVKDAQLNLKTPFLRTAADTYEESKKAWKLHVEGTVERDFLFGTVLAKDLIPFVVRKLSLIVLPVIETSHGDLKMIDSATALGEQFQHAHDWFSRAENTWRSGRRDQNYEFADWLNYHNKLTAQSLSQAFVVLTNKSGTNLCAAMLAPNEAKKVGRLPIRGFIAENVTYRYYAKSEGEAHYLVGILNTSIVNEAIKPFQPQGLLGERDIHRRPFEVCHIPLFDSKESLHLKIAELSCQCREELLPFVPKMQTPVATARADARRIVQGKLNTLDELVRKLIGNPASITAYPPHKDEPLKLMELF